MEDQILTEHFRLSEFTRSATAERHHIDNTIPSTLIPNLKNLCKEVLEPLRQHVGVPVIISSGYRSPELNRLVGGVKNSQHQSGEAADILIGNQLATKEHRLVMNDCFIWIQDNCSFDQLIFESNGTTRWIHVSCKPDITQNRQRILRLNQ